MNSSLHVSIIGLGKLGGPFLAAITSRGFGTIGVEIDSKTIEEFNSGKISSSEPYFATLIRKFKNNISITTSYETALANSDIIFIAVPTPSKPNGLFSNKYVKRVIQALGNALRDKKRFHVIAIVSTVVPGSMHNEILPLLEQSSGKKVGNDFGLCYTPTFVALGSVIKNFLSPDFILIGQSDTKSGDILERLYKKVCINQPAIERMNFVNAEITKLALNTYVTTKIAYANMLAQLCEHIPGTNVDTITTALGRDSRIGPKYLKGGLSYGGPCFPRDNKALTSIGKRAGANLLLPAATDQSNRFHIERLLKRITRTVSKKAAIAILGLSYRPHTDVIDASAGILIAQKLARNYTVHVYDPQALANARKILHNKVTYHDSLTACIVGVDCILITTEWEQFASLLPKKLKFAKKSVHVFDCWRILNAQRLKNGVSYHAIGVNNQ